MNTFSTKAQSMLPKRTAETVSLRKNNLKCCLLYTDMSRNCDGMWNSEWLNVSERTGETYFHISDKKKFRNTLNQWVTTDFLSLFWYPNLSPILFFFLSCLLAFFLSFLPSFFLFLSFLTFFFFFFCRLSNICCTERLYFSDA